MLDCGAHIFVWQGAALASLRTYPAIRDACGAYAARLAAGRFPLPELRTVAEVCAGAPVLCMAILYEERAQVAASGRGAAADGQRMSHA